MTLTILKVGLLGLLLSSSLLLGTGCSYAFVHGPPPSLPTSENAPDVQRAASSCTSSNAAPVIDTILAVPLIGAGATLAIAGATTKSCSSSCFGPTTGEAIAIGLGAVALGALPLSSAITGYGRTADCRRLQESLPGGPQPSARHLLDLNGIAAARSREERERR